MSLDPSSGFPYYIGLVGNDNYQSLFISSKNIEFLSGLSEQQSRHRYAEGKWSIKQIVGHMADHERIMIYRALRFSRKDSTTLSGYDQHVMTDNAPFDLLPYATILDDFKNVRKSTQSFLKTLTAEQLELKGTAWKFEISVEDVLKATIGHELHHIGIIRQRYL
jgi:uncharacterized damage-inducible protein DinB